MLHFYLRSLLPHSYVVSLTPLRRRSLRQLLCSILHALCFLLLASISSNSLTPLPPPTDAPSTSTMLPLLGAQTQPLAVISWDLTLRVRQVIFLCLPFNVLPDEFADSTSPACLLLSSMCFRSFP